MNQTRIVHFSQKPNVEQLKFNLNLSECDQQIPAQLVLNKVNISLETNKINQTDTIKASNGGQPKGQNELRKTATEVAVLIGRNQQLVKKQISATTNNTISLKELFPTNERGLAVEGSQRVQTIKVQQQNYS